MTSKIIELRLNVEAIDPSEAILPHEAYGPTTIRITPVEESKLINGVVETQISFRVAFEPENKARRVQPYRENMAPVFPNEWKLGDKYDPDNEDRFV